MIFIIDHYDSFVHMLAAYIAREGRAVKVIRPDEIELSDISALSAHAIILSPGPGHPQETEISQALIKQARCPILGVCLGHQAIAYTFDGEVAAAKYPCHGQAATITHLDHPLFANIPNPMQAGLYHSLAVTALPADFAAIAHDQNGEMMAMAHKDLPIYGVQFHPESILTLHGHVLLQNFLQLADV